MIVRDNRNTTPFSSAELLAPSSKTEMRGQMPRSLEKKRHRAQRADWSGSHFLGAHVGNEK